MIFNMVDVGIAGMVFLVARTPVTPDWLLDIIGFLHMTGLDGNSSLLAWHYSDIIVLIMSA